MYKKYNLKKKGIYFQSEGGDNPWKNVAKWL
jgi:hypothetical protein